MMMDPRSPVRAGQPLAVAAEQVNWINRQMRGDSGFRAGDRLPVDPSALVVPCRVTTTVPGVIPGHVVRLISAAAFVLPNNDGRVPSASVLSGNVATPVGMNSYEATKEPFGVIVGGTTMPQPGFPRVVSVCIAGLCVARVRSRTLDDGVNSIGPFRSISLCALRPGDDAESLSGAAEASSCGPHRLVAYLGEASQSLQYAAVVL